MVTQFICQTIGVTIGLAIVELIKFHWRKYTVRRQAIIQALTLSVCCPYCGEPQPSPNGSGAPYRGNEKGKAWMPSQITPREGYIRCVSCDDRFCNNAQTLVSVASEGTEK